MAKPMTKTKIVAALAEKVGLTKKQVSTFFEAQAALARTAEFLAAKGAQIHYFDFAPEYNENRKPEIGHVSGGPRNTVLLPLTTHFWSAQAKFSIASKRRNNLASTEQRSI